MKHLILSTLIFLVAQAGLFAQSPRIPLLEHFTNTKCSVCKSKNPQFYALFEPYKEKVHHIAIHPSVPYSTCALYLANTADNGARQQYYSIFGTPLAYINGSSTSGGSTIVTKQELDAALALSSPIEIQVTENAGFNRTVNVNVKTSGNVAAGNYVLHAMVVERELNFNSPNGETLHHDVMRKMLPSNAGTAINLGSAGNEQDFPFTYTIDNSWQENQIYLVAFVQNTQTKEILNSGSKLIKTSAVKNDSWRAGKLTITPNPAGNYLNLKLEGQHPVAGTFQILDLSGKTVLTGPFGLSTGVNRLAELSLFPAGAYYLQLVSPSGTWQGTFVK